MSKSFITLFILLSCATCFGQSSFQEITPGASKRDDVARILGQPVRSIGSSLVEYAPPAGFAKVEVEYRTGSDLVERVEVYFDSPLSRQALIQKFGLTQADAKKSTEGKLVEYFGGTSLLALAYASADSGSGVSHIGYYSRKLFDSAMGKTTGARQNPGTRNSSSAGSGGNKRTKNKDAASRSADDSLPMTVITTADGLEVQPSKKTRATAAIYAEFAYLELSLSASDLRKLGGVYQFIQPSGPGVKPAAVSLVAGKLQLTMGALTYTLAPILRDDFVVGDQGESDVFSFRAAGERGVKVYFTIVEDKPQRLYIVESQHQPKRFSVAVPKL